MKCGISGYFGRKTTFLSPPPLLLTLMSAVAVARLSPASNTSSEDTAASAVSAGSIAAVQHDVQRRLRAVRYMEAVFAKSSSSFCSLELSPLLEMRKRPLEEMKQQCEVLAEYGAKNNLW